MAHDHIYKTQLHWSAEGGKGTESYRSFSRTHRITAKNKAGADKPAIVATSAFHSLDHYNPDELLIGSLSSCHMLWYLHLCADAGVVVTAYADRAAGTLALTDDGGGHFKEVTLRPAATIRADCDTGLALALHERAHHLCFIANSMNFEVTVEPTINVE